MPIYQTATWGFDTVEEFADVLDGRRPGHAYGRGYGNPTVEAFEAVMADLEGTEAAFGFASGMAAVHAVVTSLAAAGDRIVSGREIYGGTHSFFATVLPRYGVGVTFVDTRDHDAVRAALRGARLLYVETIANPLVRVADLAALHELCEEAGAAGVVDNTFASPYLCNPAASGWDFVLHSATKYIGGHSDLLGGVVCASAAGRRLLRATSLEVGGAMQPFEAWLCLRGLATLGLRMERHCAVAGRLAQVLSESEAVAEVHYPGLPNHPDNALATRQLRGFGGMLAFELRSGLAAGIRFCEALELMWLGASLGGAHSLVAHPASTTHRQLNSEERQPGGIGGGLVRMSVGLEDEADLVADVRRALAAAG